MKVQWLNEEMTEALVTRGWWRWKRQAHVRRVRSTEWVFVVNGEQFPEPSTTYTPMECARRAELARRKERRREDPWQPVGELPTARLLRDSAQS